MPSTGALNGSVGSVEMRLKDFDRLGCGLSLCQSVCSTDSEVSAGSPV